MKNEIKEILEKMEDISYKYTTNWLELHYKDVKMLYDYITNLQEENKKLNYILNNKFANICIKEMIGKLSAVDMIVLQQDKINKAIEYIKVGKTFDNEDVRKVVNKIQNDLLNILQGSDDNE